MVANIKCPTCGHSFRTAVDATTKELSCPSCLNSVPIKQRSAPSLLSRPTPERPNASASAGPPNKTILAQPEQMVHYTCPRCGKSLESPQSYAGQKLNCPDCNQRLQIPQPSTPPVPPVNKTVLAKEDVPRIPTPPPSGAPVKKRTSTSPPPSSSSGLPQDANVPIPAPSPALRESCLECGTDITRQSRVQTCPDCGSMFCSSACSREHRYHAHRPRRKKAARPVECDRCGSTYPPYQRTVISQTGWVLFVVLLILFFPLCWIGLLMTETQINCSDCGVRLY